MKQTGYLKIDGQVSRATWNDFTSLLFYLHQHNVQPEGGNKPNREV